MGAGFPPAQARFSEWGAVKTAISAAGSTQGTATALSGGDINLVTTATALQGVQLPNAEIQDSVIVFNDGSGVTIVVYPPSSGTINQLSANTGMNLVNNTAVMFVKVTATRWIAFLSA
jgi:methyl coenzyme M reductase subunit C